MNGGGAAGRQAPGDSHAVALVAVLLIIYAFAYLDRQIINLLVEPLKADLQISDVDISFLQGAAFVIFYTLFGLPIGFLVDRLPRRPIIFAGILFWSLASAAGGLAQTYDQLLLARFGVGAGEAALLPAAYSMIGDAVSRERLSRAIAFFSLGAIGGGALALTLGGYLVKIASDMGGVSLPWLGSVASWQLVFLIIGTLGVPASLLIFLVPEPARKVTARSSTANGAGASTHLRAHRRFYVLHIAGFSIMCLVMAGNAAWQPAFMQRAFGWNIAHVGAILGLVHMAGGVGGMLGSGFLADFLQARGYRDAHMRLYLFAMPVMAIAATAAFSSGNLILTLMGLTILSVAGPFIAVAASGLALATPANQRGIVSGVFLFCYNIVGFGAGPTVVASLSEWLAPERGDLGTALTLSFVGATPVIVLLFYLGLKPMRSAVEAAAAAEAAAHAGEGQPGRRG